jgi:hypothetical protein
MSSAQRLLTTPFKPQRGAAGRPPLVRENLIRGPVLRLDRPTIMVVCSITAVSSETLKRHSVHDPIRQRLLTRSIQKRLRKANAGPLRSSDYCVNEISPGELVRQKWGSPNL